MAHSAPTDRTQPHRATQRDLANVGTVSLREAAAFLGIGHSTLLRRIDRTRWVYPHRVNPSTVVDVGVWWTGSGEPGPRAGAWRFCAADLNDAIRGRR
jgi:hypothetical protein